MDPETPPWRVFDAPATPPATQAGAPDGRSSPTSAVAAPKARLGFQASVLLPLVGAAALIVAAVVVAAGSIGDGTTVDTANSTDRPPVGSGIVSGGIVVEVVGAVARPGVYHVPAGSRVGDVIAAAGGFGPRVAADRVDAELNLAAIVHDGDRIVVPSRDGQGPSASSRPAGGAAGSPATALIDLNHATREQLDSLPGIGLVTADKIIASRAEKPFASIEELRDRGLIGQKTFDKLRALITVG